jgi:hypothetical protein
LLYPNRYCWGASGGHSTVRSKWKNTLEFETALTGKFGLNQGEVHFDQISVEQPCPRPF